jgi:high affinity sulfate transporter 1
MGWGQLAPTFRGYQVCWLVADAIAGLTLVAVALPSQMATARLAALPAVAGLYAFIAGSLMYALLGTDRHLSVGADSTIAPILAAGVASSAAAGSAGYGDLMAFTSLLVGGLLVAAGLLRLAWIADFLSSPVITGVLGGIAVEIVLRQLPVVLGVAGGGTTTLGRVRVLIDQAPDVNGWTIAIAACVMVVIVGSQQVSRRLPGALAALVLSIVAVDVGHLSSRHGVAVLGALEGGLPRLTVPSASWSQLHHLSTTVVTVAFVCVAQSAATVRASNTGAPATDDFNRDLIGIGAGSVLAGFVGAIAVDASPPNTAITAASGGRSQVANLFAAAVVLVVVLVATAPLAHLPAATLGATLIFVATKLVRPGELRRVFRFDRVEFALAIIPLVVVAIVGIEQGVVVAVALSLADRTRRSARPRDAVLGREPGSDHWVPDDVGQVTERLPGVLVYLVYAPLWYGNADFVSLRLRRLVDTASTPVHALVIDADGISDIDYTGLTVLRELAASLEGKGVAIGIARASHLVHHDLKHGALLGELGADHLFASVDEAVAALSQPGDSRGLQTPEEG